MVNLLIEYANKNGIILNLNKKENIEESSFILACRKNNNEMDKLMIDYAKKNDIILKLDNTDSPE